MSTNHSKNFSQFRPDENGSTTIIFGLISFAMMFMAGMAVDYSRVMNTRGRIAEAADSAVLAAGRAMLNGGTKAEVEALGATYFRENVKSVAGTANIADPIVIADLQTGSVKIDIDASVDMTITKIGGFNKQDIPISSEAVFSTRDIEIGMALDITGSMCEDSSGRVHQPCTSGYAKIDGLKSAFETFANRLMHGSGEQKVKIAVAPYSQSVNLGTYASGVPGYATGNNWVVERNGGGNSDNMGSFHFGRHGDRNIDPTGGGGNFDNRYRPMSPVIPLSDDKDALIQAVRALEARGGTAGHLGIQWAWNLVSDQWGGVFNTEPASYEDVADGKLIKAVVIMTDGVFNTAYRGGRSATQAVALCSAMKAKGITVFTVGLELDDTTAINTLRSCATEGTGYFANASNAAELDRAFENFASKLSELRLAK